MRRRVGGVALPPCRCRAGLAAPQAKAIMSLSRANFVRAAGGSARARGARRHVTGESACARMGPPVKSCGFGPTFAAESNLLIDTPRKQRGRGTGSV
jgi:hypothetical protein